MVRTVFDQLRAKCSISYRQFLNMVRTVFDQLHAMSYNGPNSVRPFTGGSGHHLDTVSLVTGDHILLHM